MSGRKKRFDLFITGGIVCLVVAVTAALWPRHAAWPIIATGEAISFANDGEQSKTVMTIEENKAIRVVEVVDGDSLILEGGQPVRLTGIQAPKLPLGRPGFRKWPLADEARAAIEELTLNQEIYLAYDGTRWDRHGRILAQAYRASDDLWIQGEMIRRGLARVYSFDDNRSHVRELLALEEDARAAERGIWALPYYAIRDALGDVGGKDSYQLVEGRVQAVGENGGRVYLNFDANWREDFTGVLNHDAHRLFLRDGINPENYQGKMVRLRGWIREYNGPLMQITHPEQIELLEE